ncbi:ESX secretion-associated protein EspG [Nocardia camponoti]|uniref:ESX secretion-associated protein EspG n=1 Tax=Nocardia camponoti TaxID=1616106 RepID=A0A917QM15_9NOCA|nr:ESX secretion-associated protein EspG [Nocardia camponoti]GGK57497.1 hypothetical protein GCM10011591_32060 [Nocardia camponoti]
MIALTNDTVLAVADQLRVQTLPLVLGIGPRQDTIEAWQAARADAIADLRQRGLIDDYGDVATDLADALHILSQPAAELSARYYSGIEKRRISLVRRGIQHANAIRTGDDVRVATISIDGAVADLARVLLTELPTCGPADVASVSVQADELAGRLTEANTTADYSDAMYALGVAAHDATAIGAAMGSCHAYTEIVATTHRDGRSTQAPGAVAVYDTARGRVVIAPMTAPDGRLWSTISPGTDHRVTQAIGALLEGLPGGRWQSE